MFSIDFQQHWFLNFCCNLLASPVVAIFSLWMSYNSLSNLYNSLSNMSFEENWVSRKSTRSPRSSLNEWRRAIESQLQPNRLSLGVAIPQRTRVLANSKILKFQSESPFILHPMSHYAPRTPWIMLKGNWDHKSMALTNFQEYSRLNFLDYD